MVLYRFCQSLCKQAVASCWILPVSECIIFPISSARFVFLCSFSPKLGGGGSNVWEVVKLQLPDFWIWCWFIRRQEVEGFRRDKSASYLHHNNWNRLKKQHKRGTHKVDDVRGHRLRSCSVCVHITQVLWSQSVATCLKVRLREGYCHPWRYECHKSHFDFTSTYLKAALKWGLSLEFQHRPCWQKSEQPLSKNILFSSIVVFSEKSPHLWHPSTSL